MPVLNSSPTTSLTLPTPMTSGMRPGVTCTPCHVLEYASHPITSQEVQRWVYLWYMLSSWWGFCHAAAWEIVGCALIRKRNCYALQSLLGACLLIYSRV
jgi:hypothetical protein